MFYVLWCSMYLEQSAHSLRTNGGAISVLSAIFLYRGRD